MVIIIKKINNNPSIKEIVEYSLEKIPEDVVIEIKLKDFMYMYRVLEEYLRFFHQPNHYKSLNDINEFLGSIDSGEAFEVLSTAVNKKAYKVPLPSNLMKMICDSEFEHPFFPKYYNS